MNRHLKGFIASVVLVVVCAIVTVAALTQSAWYGAIAPLVIGIIILIFLAIPCWKKYKGENSKDEVDSLFVKKCLEGLPSSIERLGNEFRDFKEKCAKLIDKIILALSIKKEGKIHTNSKTKCDFVLFSYFVMRSKLCQETRNANFIGQLDRAMEEVIPNSLLSTYDIPDSNAFIKHRLKEVIA